MSKIANSPAMYLHRIVPPERLNEKNPKRGEGPAYVTLPILRRVAYLEGRIDPGSFKSCYRDGGAVSILGEYDGSEQVCTTCGWEWADWAQVDANRAWGEGKTYPEPTK